jgi:hypothetical protein
MMLALASSPQDSGRPISDRGRCGVGCVISCRRTNLLGSSHKDWAAKQRSTSAGYTQRALDHHDFLTPPTLPAHKPQIHILCVSNIDYRLQFGKWPAGKQWWTLKSDEASSSALTKPSAIEPLQTVIRPQNQHGSKADAPHINTST